jgi:hypothetical protein
VHGKFPCFWRAVEKSENASNLITYILYAAFKKDGIKIHFYSNNAKNKFFAL